MKRGPKSYSRNKELLPKGREREGFVCEPGYMMGVPLHSLTSLKRSTNWVAYVQVRKPTIILLIGGGLGAWKKRPTIELSKINYQARQSSI